MVMMVSCWCFQSLFNGYSEFFRAVSATPGTQKQVMGFSTTAVHTSILNINKNNYLY